MPSQKSFVDTNFLPHDVFTYQDKQFYDFVSNCIGKKQADLLKFEEISSAHVYLSCTNVLDILKLESSDLIPFKKSLCLQLNDNSFIVLPGIESSFAYLTDLLMKKKNEATKLVAQRRDPHVASDIAAATTIATSDDTIPSSIPATSISTQAQFNIVNHSIVKTPDQHRQSINRAINDWITKKKDKFGDRDLKLIQGIDYDVHITVNPEKAVVLCNCGVKATLHKICNTYQVSDHI